MFNQPCIRSRQTVRQLIVLALVFSCLFTPLAGIQRTLAFLQVPANPVADANAAISKANRAFAKASDDAEKAQSLLAEFEDSTISSELDATALRNMDRLTGIVGRMFNEAAEPKTLQKLMAADQTNLTTALAELKTAKDRLDQAPADAPNLPAAKTRINSSIASLEAGTERLKLNELATQLNNALSAVYPAVTKVANSTKERLQSLQSATGQTDIFAAFQRVSQFPDLIQFDLRLQDMWPKLEKGLEKVVTDHKTKVTEPNEAVAGLHTSVATFAANIDEKLTELSNLAERRTGELDKSAGEFAKDPQSNEKAAIENITWRTRPSSVSESLRLSHAPTIFSAHLSSR